MNPLSELYRSNLVLLTDLYQLTMAAGYFHHGIHEQKACFHLFFRKLPFEGGYAIAAGLEQAIHYLNDLTFTQSDIDYLAGLKAGNENPLFTKGFLDYLSTMEFSCSVDAIPEGTVVYPHEPLLCVTGPLLQAQLIETFLLTTINFQTLVATKAARLRQVAGSDTILEFGLRRAQGIDGGVSASRAAYLGGCDATSNVLAGKLFDIPVRGTHAHSWVMTFDSEEESFEAYAEAMPHNAVLLVDTYDTLEGVKRAVRIGKKLQHKGHRLVGIRLDSGDLAYLSIEARKLLDDAGFEDTAIVASNDLDEYTLQSLKSQEGKITIWGIGTKLATAYDQPALGGVYKLAGIQKKDGTWDLKLKLSEQAVKVSNPGILQVRRFTKEGRFRGDMIYNTLAPGELKTITDPADQTRQKTFDERYTWEDLLVPIFEEGKLIYTIPNLDECKQHVMDQLSKLHPTIRRVDRPHEYPVGLEDGLFRLKTDLIRKLRGATSHGMDA